MKTKAFYAEQVLLSLQDGLRNRDEKIDPREVTLQMDLFVNEFAKAGFFENWKLGFSKVDDLWITDFFPLTVTDVANQPSYFSLPTTNYATLPNGQGINDIYFINDITQVKKRYFKPVLIKNFKDVAGYRSSMANENQGRISCYVKQRTVYFDRGKINAMYGNVGCRLVIHDSTNLADTDIYPVPAEYENQIIQKTIDFFMARKRRTPDLIRDDNDKGSNNLNPANAGVKAQ